MTLSKEAIEATIKAKIVEIAAKTGDDASDLAPDDVIPATGYIDSTSLLDLLAWYEKHFEIALGQEEITIDNLGTLSAMANFVLRRKGLA